MDHDDPFGTAVTAWPQRDDLKTPDLKSGSSHGGHASMGPVELPPDDRSPLKLSGGKELQRGFRGVDPFHWVVRRWSRGHLSQFIVSLGLGLREVPGVFSAPESSQGESG